MGVLIKAVTDGFRRGGIAHRARGTWYEDGELSEEQLESFRKERQLVVIEQAEPSGNSDQDDSLLEEMGDTIASLEHSLENARAGLKTASADLIRVLEQQKAAPALILAAAQALEPADATAEGVIFIAPDTLLSLIGDHFKPLASAEAQTDDTDPAPGGPASSVETSTEASSIAPVSSAPGADAGVVNADKPTGKRGPAKGSAK